MMRGGCREVGTQTTELLSKAVLTAAAMLPWLPWGQNGRSSGGLGPISFYAGVIGACGVEQEGGKPPLIGGGQPVEQEQSKAYQPLTASSARTLASLFCTWFRRSPVRAAILRMKT